jgi:hypothetical protein
VSHAITALRSSMSSARLASISLMAESSSLTLFAASSTSANPSQRTSPSPCSISLALNMLSCMSITRVKSALGT